MASNSIKKKNVTDIVKEFMDKCPNLKNFFQMLLMDIDVEEKKVTREFQYCPSVYKKHFFYLHHGYLMDLFIRKVLSQKYNLKLKDDYAEIILKDVETFFTPKEEKIILPKVFETHYQIYKNSKGQSVVDILESLKRVALAKTLYRKDFQLEEKMVETNKDNFVEVQKYIKSLSYSEVEIKANVDCEYFEGKPDFIFDKKVLYEIKTSKYRNLSRYEPKFGSKNFYKLLLYGFGYYMKTGIIIKKFKIYNPLLGLEFSINLNDIDMIHFEEVLKKDIEKFNV